MRSEVDSAEFPVAGVEHWFVGAYEASLFGHRSTGEVVQYLELNEEATVNGFGISPKEARRWARGLLRAADRAEGRNRPPLVLAEDECARLLAAIQAIPNTTVSPRVVAGLSLISGEVC